jgi:hypothetical protein
MRYSPAILNEDGFRFDFPEFCLTRAIFKSAWSWQTATMQPGKWQAELRLR